LILASFSFLLLLQDCWWLWRCGWLQGL